MRDGRERTAADDDLAARVAMWPTPDAQAMNDGMTPEAWAEFCRRSKEKEKHQSVVVESDLWATPTAKCSEGSQTHRSGERSGELLLNGQADLWSTPRSADGMCRESIRDAETVRGAMAARGRSKGTGNLEDEVSLWSTPRASDGEKGGPGMTFGAGGTPLPAQAALAMWATPTTQDAQNDGPPSQAARNSPPLNAQVGQMRLTPHGMAGVDSTGKEGSGGEFAGQATRWMEALWSTPRVAADRTSRSALTREGHWSAPALGQMAELSMGELPREYHSPEELTPQAAAIYHSSLPGHPTETPGAPSSPTPPGSPLPSPRKRLNPRFVEWLMGLPPGWVTGRVESINFACWATESSRRLALLLS
jgi:hypothetical protein